MTVRKSQIRAQAKWENKIYDKVLLRLRKDTEPTRETITQEAQKNGESVNEYIINAIKERINK